MQNPDSHLTYFTGYMAWWAADSAACAPGASGKGGSISQGNAMNWAMALGAVALIGALLRAISRKERRRRE